VGTHGGAVRLSERFELLAAQRFRSSYNGFHGGGSRIGETSHGSVLFGIRPQNFDSRHKQRSQTQNHAGDAFVNRSEFGTNRGLR
jgi:hypothetical protein